MQEWGSDLVKEGTVNSATVKYTDFLLATASGKGEGVKGPGKLATPFERTKLAAYSLGAMTPCMRLYAFLGKELKALVDVHEGSHPYRKWIENYSSESFQVCHPIELGAFSFNFLCQSDYALLISLSEENSLHK
jgi:thiaminase